MHYNTSRLTATLGCALLLLACTPVPTQQSEGPEKLEITNFRSGLVTFNANRSPQVATIGSTFRYEETGVCVSAGKEVPCLWHGFSFNYRSPNENARVECTILANRAQNTTDPGAKRESLVTTVNFAFELPGKNGEYVRPQYTTNVRETQFNRTTTCRHNGEVLFQFSFNLEPAQ
jgi:hypothetical protein